MIDYTSPQSEQRRWLMPVTHGALNEKGHIEWIFRNLFLPQDFVLFLNMGDSDLRRHLTERIGNIVDAQPALKIIDAQPQLSSMDFAQILEQHQINTFYSYGTYRKQFLLMRSVLLTPSVFEHVLAVWQSNSYLQHVCLHFDWMGWGMLSSLCNIKTECIPALSVEQKDWLKHFMYNVFLKTKLEFAKKPLWGGRHAF